MKVCPPSKNTLQPTRCSQRRWQRWTLGATAGVLVVVSMAQFSVAAQDSEVLTREQILSLFKREASAAYQMAREACASLADEAQKRCLAQARLQYDADRRYARKRADQGY